MGSSALLSFDLFQYILPLSVSVNDDAFGVSDVVNLLSEVKESFVNLVVDDEDWDNDEQFYEYEGGNEYSGNAFDIIVDDK